MNPDPGILGTFVLATVSRVEPYGLYMRYGDKDIIVLIPDVSTDRIEDLTTRHTAGETIRVRVLCYVDDRKLYKGTMLGI